MFLVIGILDLYVMYKQYSYFFQVIIRWFFRVIGPSMKFLWYIGLRVVALVLSSVMVLSGPLFMITAPLRGKRQEMQE